MSLSRDDLYSLEQYSQLRESFRQQVMAHKLNRRVALGPNATLYFEDRMTMQYQVQEMLRIEKIFDVDGINEELETYNTLIPDGSNWKATFMIEFPDEAERRIKLGELIGIEKSTWVQVGEQEKVFAISNEDLDRETEDKTSAVHFMRFELTQPMLMGLKEGQLISMGIDLPAYVQSVSPIAPSTQRALMVDLT